MTEDTLATNTDMDINEYQKWTNTTIAYPPLSEGDYLTAALAGEVGEFYSALAKYHRGDYPAYMVREKIKSELGDVIWIIARLADYYDMSMQEIINNNVLKLQSRKKRNVIKGSGDER